MSKEEKLKVINTDMDHPEEELRDTRTGKRKRLLIQFTILFGLIFLFVTGVSIFIQVKGSSRTYLEAKQEYMKPIMERIRKYITEYTAYDWYLDYWEAHYEEVNGLTDEMAMDMDKEFYLDIIGDPDFKKKTSQELESLSPNQQLIAAMEAYSGIIGEVAISQWALENESSMLVDLSDEHLGFNYFTIESAVLNSLLEEDTDGETQIENETENETETDPYDVDFGLGEDDLALVEEMELQEKMRAIRQGTKNEALFLRFDYGKYNTHYYIGCIPLYANGKLRCGIMLWHDWSDFHSDLMWNLVIISVIAGAFLAAMGAMLFFFINRYAVRPLNKVQKGVREYMRTKDSRMVVEKMKLIRSQNEFEELAEDVSRMAVEIERYYEENAQLNGERQRVATELELASKIQSGVLPVVFPKEKDFELYAIMNPAKEVGGDLYDFFMISEDRLGLAIGDVSGKGVPASLYMMISQLLIRQYARAGYSPAEVLTRTNQTLCENNQYDMFVTAWFGILDRKTGKIIASSAGHEFPILRGAKGDYELIRDKHGFVLGGMDMSRYKEYELQMEPGGTLLVYTDGAPEATNGAKEMFGTDRMLEVMNQDTSLNPEDTIKHLEQEINGFVGDAPQFDDLTMLCIRYLGS